MSIDHINPKEFHEVSMKLREFFQKKGLIETPVQHRLSILAACEDPTTLSSFDYVGKVWPLPQTGQMWLEHELLKQPEAAGFFCYSTSYRAEPNPVPGRHNLIFPMIEFEIPGDMNTLVEFLKELLQHLGYSGVKEGEYTELAQEWQTPTLEHEHETRIYKEFGAAFLLKNFPLHTSPFWNMKLNPETGLANKIDVILSGVECIGSAERSCDPEEMKKQFHEISGGAYANTLFSRFGRKRVQKELDRFLSHTFLPRVGGGIGVTRLIRSMKMEGLLSSS